jgi:tetratricopeptide (TPR) repeat protein
VRALLSAYHERVRAELERFGGTVEKFIGDAVMALFGAPTAHEDDPERAVRAALAIRDWGQEEGDLQVRIGITTGEALVALGARPAAGEGMASGDVVNTAARLQSSAPVNGILVDEASYRATKDVIDYGERAPVEAKGKSEPIPVWQAVEARARLGVDVAHAARTKLIGRGRELDVLRQALTRVREEQQPQLVTLVGVPGIGKSRLVHELLQLVEESPDLIWWRQGRSLPYGEGISYWALAEMVKAQAGVLESDSAQEAQAKLRRAVDTALTDEAERDWVEGHLRPLIGLAGEIELTGDRRGEAFAAWRRFFEALAVQSPLVLVFEDLQWADEGMLDFVDYLVEWASGVPLLVVAPARPELLARRAGWGGGKANATTISLSPLSDEETAHLLAALLERAVLPAETQQALLAQAGGNPLYAEQYARMLAERGDDVELGVPENVQGIIAARLDALRSEEKELLQTASVVGKVFWDGALAHIDGQSPFALEELLHALERKEFVHRERRSLVAGENGYAFRHVLVRDVAYGQIPRGRRSEKHRLTAEWIESLAADRSEDRAEMLAHHYSRALEYARAAGAETKDLARRVRLALREAGDRAAALNAFAAAARFYKEALELWPGDDPERPRLLFVLGQVLYWAEWAGAEELTEARDALLDAGDAESAAEAEVLLSVLEWERGQRDRAFEHSGRAVQLLEHAPASRAKAHVLSGRSRLLMLAGESEEAILLGREAIAIAERLGLEELRAHTLNTVGVARVHSGRADGVADLEESIALAERINSPESLRGYGNLASTFHSLGDLRRCFEIAEKGLREAERFGSVPDIRWLQGTVAERLYFAGEWEEATRRYDELVGEIEAGEPYFLEVAFRLHRGQISLARGELQEALADANKALQFARTAKDPQLLLPTLAFAARALSASKDERRRDELATELLALPSARSHLTDGLVDIAVVLTDLGRGGELHELAASSEQEPTRWLQAALAFVSKDFIRAADLYAEIGTLPDEAYARLRGAAQFVGEERRQEADAELQKAVAFWRSVGATAYVQEGEALLAKSA